MSEGTGVPAEWTRQPAQPVQGQQPGAAGPLPQGQPPQGQPPVPQAPQPAPPVAGQGGQQPAPPPVGGFGPPPVPYGQTAPGQQVPPQQQIPPTVPQPVQPQPQQWQPGPPAPALGEPDWAALADRHESESRKRRKLWIGATALALVLVGGGVAAGLMMTDKGDKGGDTKPTTAASSPGTPSADPVTFISDAGTDKAPVDPAVLFADQTRTIDGKVWTRKGTGITTPCSKATTGGLGKAISDEACRSLVRATYVSGDSAVTIGIAVFDNKATADVALAKHIGAIQGLPGQGVGPFCTESGCSETHGYVGRYGYFTVAGTLKQGAGLADPLAAAAAPALSDYAKDALLSRAKGTGAGH
ncbi:hypothetical protein [Kitasatospora sp. NPDC050543]|uniref:hypothetical protein n=1 Tax=Kitasatospora sp. NPDC050543 TaxID=3364054 RepID=UPI0037A73368